MPAPKFLAGLPKPLLFALYGAVGGLLGAVAFGEPAWQLLKPPPPVLPAQVAVGGPASVTLYPGSQNSFVVRVVRERFEGPVVVTFDNPPAGVTIPPVTVPAEKTEGEAKVIAAPGVPTGTKPVTLTATAAGGVTAAASVGVEVIPVPPPPPAIALAVPSDLVLYKRGTSKFPAAIARRGYDGPVTLTVAPLPAGVTAAPVTIGAGATDAEVTLVATDVAVPAAELTITAEAPGLIAKDRTRARVEAPPVAPVDVVFVLDVTASMQWAIDDLKNGIGKFADSLAQAQIDFRLGLVTFQDLTIPGEKVEVVHFKNGQKEEPFTSNSATFRDKVAQLKAGGGGDIPESSLEGVGEACKLPFRQGASKILLLITDAPPKVVPADKTAEAVQGTAKRVRDASVDSVHLVVQRFDVDVYKPLMEAGADKAGGKYFNLGDVVRGDEGFDGLLTTFSRVVTAAALAKRPDAAPNIAAPPAPPAVPAASSAVPKATELPPPPSVQGVQSSGQFAAGTEGRLTLAIGVWTAAIAALVCLFLLGGQHHYLRGSLPAAGGALAGFLGGLVVGLLGGAAGQGLFLLAHTGNELLGHVFRVFGWALLGGLAGVGLSLFIPNMKWAQGLLGGAVGGAAGAVGFILVSAVTGDLVGRLVGGLVLGFCIGLMVAVAETAFRRAWLEVRYGERERITVTLGPEPVKVGSDAKACTVWARGAPPVALRFFVRDGQVICDDAATGRETAVADGFAKEVGTLTVTVRTGSGTAAPAAAPLATRSKPAPKPTAKEQPLSLDDDGFDLPMPAAPSAPAPPRPAAPYAPPPKPAAAPAKPPVPTAGAKPAPAPPRPTPPAPKPPAPAVTPAIKPAAKNPDACPSCGRVVAGKPGQRYCMICDQTY